MGGHEAMGSPREASVRDQRDALPQSLADDRSGDGEHLSHPWPTRGSLATDHDDVAGRYLTGEHSRHGGLLAVEHTRRAGVVATLVAGELDYAPIWSDIAAQDRETAGGLQWI